MGGLMFGGGCFGWYANDPNATPPAENPAVADVLVYVQASDSVVQIGRSDVVILVPSDAQVAV